METTTLKLIAAEELGAYGPAKSSKTVKVTVMSGKLRKEVKEMTEAGKKEQVAAIISKHTFSIQLDFTRMPISKIIELAASPQSLIVSLQNGLIRPAGDEAIEAIAAGEEGTLGDFKYSKKVLYILVKSWISRPSNRVGASPEQKLETMFGKLTPEQQTEFIKRMQEKK